MAQPKHKEAQENANRDISGLMSRAANLEAKTANDEDRSIDLVWSTEGSDVVRYDWRTDQPYSESLSLNPKHVRLGRLNDGGPLLDSHQRYSVSDMLGAVVPGTAKVNGKEGTARVRFSMRDDVTPIWNDVKAGIIRSVSVGYAVHKWEVTASDGKTMQRKLAVDWEPHELSMVPIPADAGAGTREYELAQNARDNEERMTEEERRALAEKTAREAAEAATRAANELAQREQAAEAKRVKDVADAAVAAGERAAAIVEVCAEHNIDAAQRTAWLRGTETVSAVKVAILDGMRKRTEETHISPAKGGDGKRTEEMQRDAVAAVLRNAGEKIEGDGHRNFGDGSIMRVAERMLRAGGVNTDVLSKHEIAGRALATGDFSAILYITGEKMMRKGYESNPLVHRDIFRKSTNSDFRAKNQILVESGGILPEIPENGVIPQGDAQYEKNSYALKSYGQIVAVTRKMLIDDDVSAVTTIAQQRGRSAAETERKLVWDFVMQSSLAGPTSQDGTAVFTTAHGNFPAAIANATTISTTTLAAARLSFANRLGPRGFSMNASMKHVVVSAIGEQDFDTLLNGLYVPTAMATAVTARARQITLHVEPLISLTLKHFYGFTDVNQVDNFEYAYLAGQEGARLEQRNGFNPEGLEMKVCLDFGVGITDWRGCYLQRAS